MTATKLYRNRAAWIDGPGQGVRVGPHDLRKPGVGQVLIRNRAVAINPYDVLQSTTGEFVEQWPCIFGHDLAGEIIAVGEGVDGLHKGQRVLAQALHGSLMDTAFQEHSIVGADVICPIPDSLPFESASVIPLALTTAAAGLYQTGYLELPLPQASPKKTGKTLLVWGGSSSVGSAAIQLAVASGLDVIATASPRNFEYCRALGAKDVFDYASPTVVEDLAAALGSSKSLAGAYAVVSSPGEIIATIAKVLERLGGGFIATTKPPPVKLPKQVSAKMGVYAAVEGHTYFRDFLPSALKDGRYRAMPDPYVVGDGLHGIQTGLEVLGNGVSAKKVVVTMNNGT